MRQLGRWCSVLGCIWGFALSACGGSDPAPSDSGQAGQTSSGGELDEAGAPATVINGKDGRNGKDGTNGTNGVDGKDGKDGTNGTNGTDGTNGADGKNSLIATVHELAGDN